MTHKNQVTNQFLSKSETLDFSLLLHRKQIFTTAGINVEWAWPQSLDGFLQVGQKYGSYDLGGMI